MENCLQTEGQSVLDHGKSVWEYTKRIISGDFDGMKLPDWFIENHRFIVNNLHPAEYIKLYNIYHDCGKPYCLEVDEEGRRHFPNHAQVSKDTFLNYFSNETVANLINLDMFLHVGKADELDHFYKNGVKTCFTLMVTALAELHSNANMFGGIDSTSFKIKFKKTSRLIKKVFENFFFDLTHKYSYVIIRKDLGVEAKAIQGTHAAIELHKDYDHSSIVYVEVKNEKKLQKVMRDLLDHGIDFKIFREPMEPYNNSITAICTEPLDGIKREFMKKFQLYKEKNEN